jgi:hypothetical protein
MTGVLHEVFGHPATLSPRHEDQRTGFCRFRNGPCKKALRSKNGVCSLSFEGKHVAICPDRLLPAVELIRSGLLPTARTVEQTEAPDPSGWGRSDFVLLDYDTGKTVPIEIQAVNITGNISHAWSAWKEGEVQSTGNARLNQTNMYKYLQYQILKKASAQVREGNQLVVAVQDINFHYLHKRTPFSRVSPSEADVLFYVLSLTDTGVALSDIVGVKLSATLDLRREPKEKGLIEAILFGLEDQKAYVSDIRDRARKRGSSSKFEAEDRDRFFAMAEAACANCGHRRDEHQNGEGACTIPGMLGFEDECKCLTYC